MSKFNPQKVTHGSKGNVWLNGQRMASLTKCELKVANNYETINVCGELADYQVYNGWSGSGTLAFYHIDSKLMAEAAQAAKTGEMPDLEIIAAIEQRGSNKVERVKVSGVTIDEFILTSFEKKTMTERDYPFKFSDFQVLEVIEE